MMSTILTVFQECFEPAEDSLPAFAVGGSGFEAGETFLADADQRAGARFLGTVRVQSVHAVGIEFPADDGFLRTTVAADPSVDEQARGIDFEVFAFDVEGVPSAPTPTLGHSPPGRTSTVGSVTRSRPGCPHQFGSWVGSLMAWNTRAGGAAIKISAMTDSWSGVSVAVAIGLSLRCGFSGLKGD